MEVELTPEGLQLAIAGKMVALPVVKKSYGGCAPKNGYGDVDVDIGEGEKRRTYTVRIGNLEWQKAEELFKVKGYQAVVKTVNESEKAANEFYRIALARHHKELTAEEVANLRDFREDGRATLSDAIERALNFSKPAAFPDDEVDPKALAVMLAAMKALRGQTES